MRSMCAGRMCMQQDIQLMSAEIDCLTNGHSEVVTKE